MAKNNDTQEWEKNQVNALTLQMIFAATGGTLAATVLAYFLKKAGLGEVRPELLFAPWGIALVYGVSMGFHRGVEAERARAEEAVAESKK